MNIHSSCIPPSLFWHLPEDVTESTKFSYWILILAVPRVVLLLLWLAACPQSSGEGGWTISPSENYSQRLINQVNKKCRTPSPWKKKKQPKSKAQEKYPSNSCAKTNKETPNVRNQATWMLLKAHDSSVIEMREWNDWTARKEFWVL